MRVPFFAFWVVVVTDSIHHCPALRTGFQHKNTSLEPCLSPGGYICKKINKSKSLDPECVFNSILAWRTLITKILMSHTRYEDVFVE